MDSINNLLKQVRDVSDFVCPLSRLFAVVKNRASRVELCKVFSTIKDIQPAFTIISQLASDVKTNTDKRQAFSRKLINKLIFSI